MKVYKLEAWKAYEGSTFLGVFTSRELAEAAKVLAEKITRDFDSFTIDEIPLHTDAPAWRAWVKRRFTCRRFKRRA